MVELACDFVGKFCNFLSSPIWDSAASSLPSFSNGSRTAWLSTLVSAHELLRLGDLLPKCAAGVAVPRGSFGVGDRPLGAIGIDLCLSRDGICLFGISEV